jgi:regulation of enolase protein 1 (concanavalin A-like superfamily)
MRQTSQVKGARRKTQDALFKTQIMTSNISIPTLPYALSWQVPAVDAAFADGTLAITAGPKTDLFTDPRGLITIANSPRLMFQPEGDFMLSATVTVPFASTFDAGVLLAFVDSTHWAKLCFEYSPQGQPMIVSVVNKGDSDDCNSVIIAGNTVHLRLTHVSRAFAFHYSTDQRFWHFVRYFNLGVEGATAGFSSQSPTGEGCTATFENIQFTAQAPADLRSGA